MQVTDKGRKKLGSLMIVQDVSQRSLAAAAGWKSHTLLGRILSGEVTSIDNDKALFIAQYLGVDLSDLFVTRLSTNPGHAVRPRGQKVVDDTPERVA